MLVFRRRGACRVTSGKALTPTLFLVGLCAAAALFDRLGMVSERVPVVVGACMFLCFGGQHQAPKCNPKATWGKSHPQFEPHSRTEGGHGSGGIWRVGPSSGLSMADLEAALKSRPSCVAFITRAAIPGVAGRLGVPGKTIFSFEEGSFFSRA